MRAAVRMRHTRAHTGVAGNEAADGTAKAAAAGDDYEMQRYDEVARETYEEYRCESPPGQQGVHVINAAHGGCFKARKARDR